MTLRSLTLIAAGLALVLTASRPLYAAGAAPGPGAPVLLKSRVLVEGDVVRLGDLFEGTESLSGTAVARAPAPGQRVDVDARWLAAVAKAYALPWQPSSRYQTLTIERASQTIETARIEAATLEALAARGVGGRVSVVFDNPALRLVLPTDAAGTLAVAALSYDPASGRFAGQVVAPAEGTPLARATISGRAVEMADIPVLNRRVEPGEVIGRADVEWISVRADRISRNTVGDPDRLLGMSPRRPIRAGEAVLGADLREPVLVEKNAIVTIRLEHPRMVLTAQGRALDQGAAGDVIRVMNTKSKMVVNAAVTESGEVLVYAATLAGEVKEARQ